MTKIPTCTTHCEACKRHFRSLEAFELHRHGDYSEAIGSELGRRCLHPIEVLDSHDNPLLVEHGVGECRMYREVMHECMIWTSARSITRQERFSELGGAR